MARLKSKNVEPPNGWRYVQPETGERINADGEHLGALVDLVMAHRRYKGLKPDDRQGVQLDVERQLCLGLDQECQPEAGEDRVVYKDNYRGITAESITSFSKAIFEYLKNGGGLVAKAESERRAAICRGCKFNRIGGTCMCNAVFEIIKSLLPGGRIEPGLKVCGICGCSIEVKAVCPDEVVRVSNEGRGLVYPSYCWQSQLS
jgi:hypothetical protein